MRLDGGKGGSSTGQGHLDSCRDGTTIWSHDAGCTRNTVFEQRSPTVSWAAERAAPRAESGSVGWRWVGGVLERAVVASGWVQCVRRRHDLDHGRIYFGGLKFYSL